MQKKKKQNTVQFLEPQILDSKIQCAASVFMVVLAVNVVFALYTFSPESKHSVTVSRVMC